MKSIIREIEAHSFHTLAALEEADYDGWRLRVANGYTRRANSVNPIFGSSLDVDEKLAYCENWYAQRQQRMVVKMTEGVYPENLDSLLVDKGFLAEGLTSVLTIDLTEITVTPGKFAYEQDSLSTEWLRALGRDPRWYETVVQMHDRISVPKRYIVLKRDHALLAIGRAVLKEDLICFLDIKTMSTYRRQGWGHAVMQNLIHWGKSKGAARGYLQVVADNLPAQQLYAQLGFQEAYRYWYRAKSPG